MSRHEVKAKNPKHTSVVGYDHGLKTFFAQVRDSEIERLALDAADRIEDDLANDRNPAAADVTMAAKDSIVFWIGAERVSEITRVEQLVELLAPYAELDAEMIETLRGDQKQEEREPRTQHQINMLELVMKSNPAGGKAE